MSALELSQRVAQLDEMIDQLDAFMDSLMVDLVIPDPDEQERDELGDQVLVDVPGPAGARLPVSNHGLLSARETSDPVPAVHTRFDVYESWMRGGRNRDLSPKGGGAGRRSRSC